MSGAAGYGRAAIILCVGIAAYIVQDLIMKIASGHYPIHQALVFRAMTAIPIALLFIYWSGTLKAIKGSTRPLLPRSLLTVACNLTYYLALAALPMATVGALYLSAPLMITALSVLLLQEKVNGWQWAAVAAGFVGVVLIIHPGAGIFEWAMVLPLLSALTYAGAVIYVRKAGEDGDSGIMSLQSQAWLSLTGLVLGLLLGAGELKGDVALHPSMSFLLSGWQWPSLRDALVLLACGVVGSISTYLLTRAYALSDASSLAPFEYTALLWSIALGWLVFGHFPPLKDWFGIALLVGAGLLSVYMAEKKGPAKASQPA